MTKDEYIELFKSLRFHCKDKQGNRLPVEIAYNAGRTLRHPDTMLPTVYFCGNEHGVYFVVKSSQNDRFGSAWRVFGPQKDSDNNPRYMTLIPLSGFERVAFEGLLSGLGRGSYRRLPGWRQRPAGPVVE